MSFQLGSKVLCSHCHEMASISFDLIDSHKAAKVFFVHHEVVCCTVYDFVDEDVRSRTKPQKPPARCKLENYLGKGTAPTSEKSEQPDKGSALTFAQSEDNRLAEIMGDPEVIRLAEVMGKRKVIRLTEVMGEPEVLRLADVIF